VLVQTVTIPGLVKGSSDHNTLFISFICKCIRPETQALSKKVQMLEGPNIC